MDEQTVRQLIEQATTPLQAELRALRAEVADLRARLGAPVHPSGPAAPILETAPEPSSVESTSSPEGAIPAPDIPAPNIPTDVPAERTDFMRFIQRGLEQEEREYAKEPEPAKPEKKGWNPFKR